MRSMGVSSKLVAGLAAVPLLLLTGCSSGTSSSTNSPLSLGILGPMTGARADVGQGMVTGADLALNVINANGGVLGHQVNLSVQDDAGDPGDAVPAAQKEIQSDGIVAMVGPTSLTASVVLPLIAKANIPMLMWGGGAAFDLTTDPHFFRMTASDTEQADAMIIYAKSKGWTQVALAIGNTSADQSLTPGLVSAAKSVGITIQTQVTITIGSTSFRSEIQNLYKGNPQAILGQFDITSAGVLFGELAQQGLLTTPWVASNLWYANEWVKSVGTSVSTGPIYIANPASAGSLGEAAFLAELQKQRGTNKPSNGEEQMWDATITWALGVDQAGSWTSPQVEAGIVKAANGPGTACGDYPTCYSLIKAGKAIEWQGASSTVDFDKYHNVFGPFDILQYQADGTTKTLQTFTPVQIEQALAGG